MAGQSDIELLERLEHEFEPSATCRYVPDVINHPTMTCGRPADWWVECKLCGRRTSHCGRCEDLWLSGGVYGHGTVRCHGCRKQTALQVWDLQFHHTAIGGSIG